MNENLVKLPFDQYQRYRDIVEIANLARKDKPLKVLDVGGHPGVIRKFLTEDDTHIVDILPCDIENYTQLDGSNLPFEDNSFDFVCSLDALEHVQAESREKFVTEMVRVSDDITVVVCPFFDENIKLAEQIAFDFHSKVLNAPLVFLGEHLEYGLPELKEVEKYFKNCNLESIAIPSGYLYNWLPMQLVKIYIQSLSDAQKMEAMLDEFYNKNYYETDHQNPSYRKVVVASKKSSTILTDVLNRFKIDPKADNDLISSIEAMKVMLSISEFQRSSKTQELLDEVENAHQILRDKDTHITNLENIIKDKEKQVQSLEDWAKKIQQTIPYKVYSSVKKMKK